MKLLNTNSINLWNIWESTSFKLEKIQSNLECVKEEKISISHRINPYFNISDKLMNLINNLEEFESTIDLNSTKIHPKSIPKWSKINVWRGGERLRPAPWC